MNNTEQWSKDFFITICDELQEFCNPIEFMPIAELVTRWRETKNPHFMDAATILCAKAGVPITPILQREITAAADARINDFPAGTAKKVGKEILLHNALWVMANLHHAGLSIPQASRKAQTFTDNVYTAETLERYYGERMRPKREASLRAQWSKHIPDHREQWQDFIKAAQDPPE
jgi:hypothetical protein